LGSDCCYSFSYGEPLPNGCELVVQGACEQVGWNFVKMWQHVWLAVAGAIESAVLLPRQLELFRNSPGNGPASQQIYQRR
jgi:hypothetical protein